MLRQGDDARETVKAIRFVPGQPPFPAPSLKAAW
jgi:hypothetical protein